MGKSKRHFEDKHYEKQQKNNISYLKTNVEYLKLFIDMKIDVNKLFLTKNKSNLINHWNLSEDTKTEIIKCLNEIVNDKLEIVGWSLKCIPNLFDFLCKKQEVSLVLFIVLNFKNKYYAKISLGEIIDWTDLTNNKQISIHNLKTLPLSSWWIKGFNICSQQTECVICYENTIDNIKTTCNHILCRKCIGMHLKTKTECPYCRTSLICDRRGPEYDNNRYAFYEQNNVTSWHYTDTARFLNANERINERNGTYHGNVRINEINGGSFIVEHF